MCTPKTKDMPDSYDRRDEDDIMGCAAILGISTFTIVAVAVCAFVYWWTA